jgi:hypothetical protein
MGRLGDEVEEGERGGGAREGGATVETKQATDEDVPVFSTDMVFMTYEIRAGLFTYHGF